MPDDFDTIEGEVLDEDATVPQRPEDQTQPLSAPPDEPDGALTGQVEQIMSEVIRTKRTSRLAIFPLAAGFIGLGALLLAENQVEDLEVAAPAAAVILMGALVLTYIFRFFQSGRRERGLFFLAVIFISWGGLVALTTIDEETFPLEEFWPLAIAGIGIAFFITFLFERSHQVGLIFPGIILLFASGVSFTLTLEIIDRDALEPIRDYWPLAISFVGLALIPAALRER